MGRSSDCIPNEHRRWIFLFVEAANGNPNELLGVLHFPACSIKDFISRSQAFWGDEKGLRGLITNLSLREPVELALEC